MTFSIHLLYMHAHIGGDYHAFTTLESTTTTITNSERPVPPAKPRDIERTKPPAPPQKPRIELPSEDDTHSKPKKSPLLPKRKVHTFEKAVENSSVLKNRRETGLRSVSSPADVQTIENFCQQEIVTEQQSAEVGRTLIDTRIGAPDASGHDTTGMFERHESNSIEESVNYTEPLAVNLNIPTRSNIAYDGSAVSNSHFPSQLSNSADNSELISSSADRIGAESLPVHSYDEPHTFW